MLEKLTHHNCRFGHCYQFYVHLKTSQIRRTMHTQILLLQFFDSCHFDIWMSPQELAEPRLSRSVFTKLRNPFMAFVKILPEGLNALSFLGFQFIETHSL